LRKQRIILSIIAVATLVGCQRGDGASESEAAIEGTNSGAQRFIACLNSHGLRARFGPAEIGQGAFANGWENMVFIDDTSVPPNWREVGTGLSSIRPTSEGVLAHLDNSGVNPSDTLPMIAVASSEALAAVPELHDAYAACETEFPDFRQDFTPLFERREVIEQIEVQRDDILQFAQCARDNGFLWAQDPAPMPTLTSEQAVLDALPSFQVPGDVTPTEFRELLNECYGTTDRPWAFNTGVDFWFREGNFDPDNFDADRTNQRIAEMGQVISDFRRDVGLD